MTGLMDKYLDTFRCMSPGWVARRISYQLKLGSGWFRLRYPGGSWEKYPLADLLETPFPADPERYLASPRDDRAAFFFDPGERFAARESLLKFDRESAGEEEGACVGEAERILRGNFRYFSRHEIASGFPPDWFANPFQSVPGFGPDQIRRHWSEIDDFARGDIKSVWELSRFGFVYPLVRAHWRTGDERYAEGFWRLVEDWWERNPPHRGPQWKCGQEIAFRLMAWIFGLHGFAGSPASTPERVSRLARMIAVSADRIAGNISHALSQKNNHPISEALGLWTVGLLFPEFGRSRRWRKLGRRILEAGALELIYPDGSFSQHSVNYHRLVLDDYAWALALARRNGVTFSRSAVERVGKAARWLAALIDPASGLAPNLGANDGSLILPLSNCGYRDFRPAVQASAVLTSGKRVLDPGPWDEALFWLGVPVPSAAVEQGGRAAVRHFPDGGYLVLRGKSSRGVVRCTPEYRHRPSHADQLHLDLWRGAVNVLRDSGTYSYNAPPDDLYFPSTAAHNTVEFDDRDQMPRLSRFLFGRWLGVKTITGPEERAGAASWEGGYRDWRGCRHQRRVELGTASDTWMVTDRVSGYREKAVLRWRLDPEIRWELAGRRCSGGGAVIEIAAGTEPAGIRLARGRESLYYLEKREIPVLEVTLRPPRAEVKTVIKFID